MRNVLGILLLVFASTISQAASNNPSIQGDFSFLPRADYRTGTSPYHVAIGDLNEDGYPDLVTANASEGAVTVRLNSGGGAFPDSFAFRTDAGPRWVELGDLNNDGHLDLVTANIGASTLSLRFGDGSGDFGSSVSIPTGFPATSVVITDANRDGMADLIATVIGSTGIVEVFLGTGLGAFGPRKDIVVGKTPFAVVAKDLNGDGWLDLAVADHGAPKVWVLRNTGTLPSYFSPPLGYDTWTSPWGLAVDDLNSDGAADIVSANDSSPTATVFLNTGSGTFSAGTHVDVGRFPYSVAIGDLDLDSKPDLVATNDVSNTVTILAGAGDGTFTTVAALPVPETPISVALGDLRARGALDIVVANQSGHSASVFLRVTGETPSATSLAVSPAASVYGEPLTLTASVAPDDALGTVQFYANGTFAGSAEVADGIATIVVSGLLHREHSILAWYRGSDVYTSSRSADVGHLVALASTSMTIQPNEVPVLQTDPVWFTASVTPVAPGGGVPQGVVQFRVDGIPFGAPATLVNGTATSITSTDFASGAHGVEASYLPADTIQFVGCEAADSFTVEPSHPRIVSVRDVPGDQGGKVFVTWRCLLDGPDASLVSGYRVWRRIAPADAARAMQAGAVVRRVWRSAGNGTREEFWEAIADLPAARLSSYGYTAATTQDSLASGNPYTAFMIQGLTRDPEFWLMSPPDSGYSVDNLSPPAPAPFVATYSAERVELHWGVSAAADFREFRLHRGTTLSFVPGAENLILAGPDTGFVEPAHSDAKVYKLTAVDVHGNVSRTVTVSPDGPVAAVTTLVRVEAASGRISILWYSDAASGREVTVYRRTAELAWAPVGQVPVGSDGFISFEDVAVTSGIEYGYRVGLQVEGSELFSAAVWARLESLRFSFAGASPNPLHSGPLRVRFVLPEPADARIEVLDIGGRRVAIHEAPDLGAGQQDILISGVESLPSGVYVVRFSTGTQRITRRLAIVR